VGATGLGAAFAAARVTPSEAREAAAATARVDVAESVACMLGRCSDLGVRNQAWV